MSRKTLLCVEKSVRGARARCAALEAAGYTVIAAENVADALRIFVSQTVDAMLLDAEYARGKDSPGAVMNSIRPQVPIILMRGEDAQVRKLLYAGVFRKRHGNRTLVRMLDEIFGEAGASPEAADVP